MTVDPDPMPGGLVREKLGTDRHRESKHPGTGEKEI